MGHPNIDIYFYLLCRNFRCDLTQSIRGEIYVLATDGEALNQFDEELKEPRRTKLVGNIEFIDRILS